jgi:hypothetical protein
LSPSVSLPEKEASVSNLTSIDSIQVSDENAVIEHQVEVNPTVIHPVGIDSSTLKQTTSMYPRIVSKLNPAPSELITTGTSKANLSPKLHIPKHGSESFAGSREQRIVSVFIKQENFENSVNQKVNKDSKKRKFQDINNGKDNSEYTNAKCNKETRKQNIKDVDLDNYVEQVACYKCKFCSFLMLEKEGVVMHIQLVHVSQLPDNQRETRHNIRCPGCENVFFSSKSLRVHLSHDHQVGDEELRTLIEVLIRSSSKDAKAKNKFHKKRKRSVVTAHPLEVFNSVDNECSDGKEIPSITNSVTQVNSSTTDMLLDERSKIRVRNLNSEVLPDLEDTRVSHSDTAAANDVRNEDSLVSGGGSDGDAREGTLVIDDSHLTQQKHAKITVDDVCEFKVIANNLHI